MPTKTALRPASEKQVAFLTKLVGEKQMLAEIEKTVTGQIASGELTTKQASGYIDYLLRQPRKPQPPRADEVTEPGLYERDGRVYKVQRTKDGQRMYAKVLVVTETVQDCEGHESTGSEEYDGEDMGSTVYCDGTCRPTKKKAKYEYAPGAFRVLDASAKIGLERANELSLQVGVCMVCGRTLTAKESVTRGIGPICAGRV
jgi:hypothetical protein